MCMPYTPHATYMIINGTWANAPKYLLGQATLQHRQRRVAKWPNPGERQQHKQDVDVHTAVLPRRRDVLDDAISETGSAVPEGLPSCKLLLIFTSLSVHVHALWSA